MKKLFLFTLFLGPLATSTLLQAQTCSDTVKPTAPDSRYTLQAGGTEVLDNTTKLIWKRCAEGLSGVSCETGSVNTYNWSGALALADNTWRLPNIKELASLVETACYNPTINLTRFPNTPSSIFWSSSPSANGSSGAWSVAFNDGYDGTNNKSNDRYVRLVRGGQ